MTQDSTENVRPHSEFRLKETQRPDVQIRLDEALTTLERVSPSPDKTKTRLNISEAEKTARDMVAAELRGERTRKQAETDKLTHLLNRRGFERILKQKTFDANQQDNPNLWLLFYDVDLFKHFNIVYGHPGGDTVLELLQKVFRKGEDVARYGGEEIAQFVDLNDLRTETQLTDDEKIGAITERVRSTMELLSKSTISSMEPIIAFPEDEIPKKVTFSVGATKYVKGEDPKKFVLRASQTALHAKDNGRNRGYTSEMTAGVLQFKPINRAA